MFTPELQLWEGRTDIYKIGDHIAHPSHGGCTIQEISIRCYDKKKVLYFVLIPECDPKITIMVPVENANRIGLREIITTEEADQILSFITENKKTTDWDSDPKSRKKTYEAALKSSDPFTLAKMIKELLVQETTVVLSNFDKAILPKAEKRLFSEIALAKGLHFDDTLQMVNHAFQ